MAIVYQVRNRLMENYSPRAVPQFVPVKRTGTRYDLGGEVVELFRVKVFAEALDRTVLVVKAWEREGRIPKPLYKVEGDQCTHWYSAAQIINCHRLMMGKYQGKKYLPKEELERFLSLIGRVWHHPRVVVDEQGNIEGETHMSIDENNRDESIPDDDVEVIHPRDRGKPFSVAQFKHWRGNLLKNMNAVLQGFQRDIVGGQARINLAWNAMNAVIRALTKKGLITEEDIRDAGVELWNEAQQNIKNAKAASEAGTMPVGLVRTPIEKARDDVNHALHETTADEKRRD